MRQERIRGPEVEAQLGRALLASAVAAGVAVTIEHHRARTWASATFVGAQHALSLAAEPTAALDDWIAGLAEAEFRLRGHTVVSLTVDRRHSPIRGRIALSALTIES